MSNKPTESLPVSQMQEIKQLRAELESAQSALAVTRKVADELYGSLLNCSPMENHPSQRWSDQSDKRHSALTAYNNLPK